ncbi:UNVERIFIED_CONTAM: hypothetical protein GTU68_055652, partial [Idotea baltica]|nr:hypothetical protein [Idotea baltica]
MIFNSIEYLIFFSIIFIVYWLLKKLLLVQNLFILIVSYLFYAFWDVRFLILIVISSAVDYFVGVILEKEKKEPIRKLLLFLSLSINVGFLLVFKYYNFFAENLAALFTKIGFAADPVLLELILPVGISFYTFQTLSYTIDVYRGKIRTERNVINFFAYVAFFPQLVAGPIERASSLLPQFRKERVFKYSQAILASRQILWGMFKKVVIADNCAIFVDHIFSNHNNYGNFVLILGAVFFAFQIYGDFSGYSDIAIGSAGLLGIRLSKNFAFPYFSRDIAEFWRRWHISLSNWFRDYIYFPLGGSLQGGYNQLRNVLVIFLVSGFWHGANWTFVFWGLFHAL